MSPPVDNRELDEPPDEETIASYRKEAAAKGVSIQATYPTAEGERHRIVVSPRGTVVLLNDVSKATFNRSHSAAEIADALQE